MKLTKSQLILLVDKTIKSETTFNVNQFTGGYIQVTSTHNNTQQNYRVALFFGYSGKKPITRMIEIKEELYLIWTKAIHAKVQSIKLDKKGMDLGDLSSLLEESTGRGGSKSTSSYAPTFPIPTTLIPSTNLPIVNEDVFIKEDIEVNNLFLEYLELRKKLKLSNSKTVVNRLLNKFYEFVNKGHNPSDIILNAITGSWKDFYEPKQKKLNIDSTLNVFDLIENQG